MNTVTHIRQGRWIKDLASSEVVDYKTVNAAKRRSREMQRGGRIVRVGKVHS